MKILCYDIGGTDIKYGIIENDTFLYKNKMPTEVILGQEALLRKLEKTTRKLISEYDIEGIGVSCAGTVDVEKGIIISPPEDIKEFTNLDFKNFFQEHFQLSCIADNDVNCFAMAESKSGAGKYLNSFLMMTIGTGIGGGIIINNNIWRGVAYQGSEFGRMFINEKKYEALASTSALVRYAKRVGLDVNNGVDVFELYDQKNEKAQKVVKEFLHNVALGIANLWYIFDPEAIIIGGGISNRSQLSEEIMSELKDIMVSDFFKMVRIENAKHANDGGMLGAYYNYLLRFKEEG